MLTEMSILTVGSSVGAHIKALQLAELTSFLKKFGCYAKCNGFPFFIAMLNANRECILLVIKYFDKTLFNLSSVRVFSFFTLNTIFCLCIHKHLGVLTGIPNSIADSFTNSCCLNGSKHVRWKCWSTPKTWELSSLHLMRYTAVIRKVSKMPTVYATSFPN